jgi:hypothetical protein
MGKKNEFLNGKLILAFLLLALLLTFCSSSTGPDIADYEIYYFNGDNLDVAEDSSGFLIIIFKKASGEDEEIKTVIPNEDLTMYDENGYILELWETGGVHYIYPVTGGTKAYAVGMEGVVVEHDKYVSENTYMVHFVDTTTGNIDYTADIIETTEEDFLAIFRDPVNDTVGVSVNNYFTNIRYGFTFSNEAGNGAVEFRTDAEGYVFRVDHYGEEIL